LGGFLKAAGFPDDVYESEMARFKVPTLRNVDRRPYPEFVKAFGHNGFFKSLEEITHFYNTATSNPGRRPSIPRMSTRTNSATWASPWTKKPPSLPS